MKEKAAILLHLLLLSACFSFLGCEYCSKRPGTYYLTDTAKSWLSSYSNSDVIFKNQFDSAVTFSYSKPVDTLIDEIWNADKQYCVLYHYEISNMTLSSEEFPFYFSFSLTPNTVPPVGNENFTITGNDGQPNTSGFTIDHSISIKLIFANQGINELNWFWEGTAFSDSVDLNGSIFYDVYSDINRDSIKYPNLITGIYFTKQHGIVCFTTQSETWVLQN